MDTSNLVVGSLSSVVAEIFQLIPFLRKSPLMVAITCIIVTAVGTWFGSEGGLTWSNLLQSLVAAMATYHFAVKPAAQTMNLPSQS